MTGFVKPFIVSARRRRFIALTVCGAVAAGGTRQAHHGAEGQVRVSELSEHDIVEKLDGRDARATVQEVSFEPGQQDTTHRHAGPVFGYVLEGEYEHAIDDEPVRTYGAGEAFYEPSGCLHRVARNPSARTKTRLLAVILHPRDIEHVTARE